MQVLHSLSRACARSLSLPSSLHTPPQKCSAESLVGYLHMITHFLSQTQLESVLASFDQYDEYIKRL